MPRAGITRPFSRGWERSPDAIRRPAGSPNGRPTAARQPAEGCGGDAAPSDDRRRRERSATMFRRGGTTAAASGGRCADQQLRTNRRGAASNKSTTRMLCLQLWPSSIRIETAWFVPTKVHKFRETPEKKAKKVAQRLDKGGSDVVYLSRRSTVRSSRSGLSTTRSILCNSVLHRIIDIFRKFPTAFSTVFEADTTAPGGDGRTSESGIPHSRFEIIRRAGVFSPVCGLRRSASGGGAKEVGRKWNEAAASTVRGLRREGG